jgi:hypothetical protein
MHDRDGDPPYDVWMRGSDLPDARAPRPDLRLSTVWVLAALLVPITLAFGPLASVDLAYLVRGGQVMFDTGEILRVDVFTFTARCEPWINQQWGAEIVVAGVFDRLGWLGLGLMRAALSAGVAGFVYAGCRRYGSHRRAAAWLTLFMGLLLLGGLQLRAQLFGLLIFAALAWLIASRAEHPGWLWWAVPLFLVWANVHGSFPLGIFLLLVAWLEDRVARHSGRRTLVVASLCVLATVVTPFGPRVWGYLVDVATDPLIREIVGEWRPPWINTYTGAAFLVSVGLAVWVLVRNRRALPWPRWIELGVFLALAASSTRNVYWWGIVLALTFARLPWARRQPAVDPRHRVNAVLLGVLAVVPLVAAARWIPYTASEPPPDLVLWAPTRLTAELRTLLRPGEPFANPQSWGSWFELTLPDHPVMVDSRFEVIPRDAVRAAFRIAETEPGWERDLQSLPVRVLVVDRETEPALVAALPSVAAWREVYSDEDGLILEREAVAPAAPLPSCAIPQG